MSEIEKIRARCLSTDPYELGPDAADCLIVFAEVDRLVERLAQVLRERDEARREKAAIELGLDPAEKFGWAPQEDIDRARTAHRAALSAREESLGDKRNGEQT